MNGANPLSTRPCRFAGGPWTRERIALLKRRWSRGASAREIAKALGGMSRSAVLGKVRRLGLAQSPRHGAARRRTTAAEADRYARERVPQGRSASRVGERPPREQRSLSARAGGGRPHAVDLPVDADIPLSRRRSLLELDRHTCRWPICGPGSPQVLFCGAEPRKGKPYCATHCARAYLPAKQTAPRGERGHASTGVRVRARRAPGEMVTTRPLLEEKK